MKRILTTLLIVLGAGAASFLVWLLLAFAPFLSFVPHLAGGTGFPFAERTYLVLLQNDAEMRATGGFISSFATMHFSNGFLRDVQIQDVFSLDGHDDDTYVEPPYPMGEMLAGDFYKGHSFHDANWYPDFATSAEEVLRFYKEEFPDSRIDGVIAVNYSAIEELVALVGPLSWQGEELYADELFHTIEYTQNNIDRHSEEDLTKRKSVLKELFPQLLKATVVNPASYGDLSAYALDMLNSGQVQLYFPDDTLQDLAQERSWDGSFPIAEDGEDLFAVVESNLGGMKSDRYISRTYEHHTTLEEVDGEYQLSIRQDLQFAHHGTFNAPLSHRYRGYIREYLPGNAQVDTDALGADAYVYKEGPYTVVGRIIEIDPKNSVSLTLSYTLPVQPGNRTFQMHTWKQSGLANTSYQATFASPIDELLRSEDYSTSENVAFLNNIEHGSNIVTIDASYDTTPPRVTHQAFVDYNRAVVQFNEPVQEFDCENIDNYLLEDTDTHVKEITNVSPVREVRCTDREATIYTRNIRTQYGEAFRLTLRNIRDRSSNVMTPNPFYITLIQRFERDAPENQ